MAIDLAGPPCAAVETRAVRGRGRPIALRWVAAAALGGCSILAALASARLGIPYPALVFALLLGLCALSSPIPATVILLATVFLRLPLSQVALPTDAFVVAFVALVVATMLWADRTPARIRGLDIVQWAMMPYLLWNIYSMFAQHKYSAGPQVPNVDMSNLPLTPTSIPRFILTAVVIPFALYTVGRYVFDRDNAIRILLCAALGFAAYSAVVSILPITGLAQWVWPRYIVENPGWEGRAVGIFNQPVVNGMVLALGFAVAMVLRRPGEARWLRSSALVVAVACGCALYLTHTRAAWLSGVVVLLIGIALAQRFRSGFVTALAVVAGAIILNWSTFTSTDRNAGGIASESEVHDRLNTTWTGVGAVLEKPLSGWGIGRFEAVNTYHHRQWSADTPWLRGYGIISHGNEVAIAAELGLIGLLLWLGVLAAIGYRMYHSYRVLPAGQLAGKPMAFIAIAGLSILLVTGLTVDLRYFDFPTAVIFLFLGAAAGCADRAVHHGVGVINSGDSLRARTVRHG